MNAEILRAFFEDRVPATVLDGDLQNAFDQTSHDVFALRMRDLEADFAVRSQHLLKLCDAVLGGQLDPEALEAVGFGMIASDHFLWDVNDSDGNLVDEILHDWASPEINYRLSAGAVQKFRQRLLTGQQTFTAADLSNERPREEDRHRNKP